MLKYEKRKIDGLLELLKQAHEEIRRKIIAEEWDETLELLQLCQESMIKIGEVTEKSEGENHAVIRHMEVYCETVYIISQNLEKSDECTQFLCQLETVFAKINEQIHEIPLEKEIVFFPYNAAMWDSLESIWMAAVKDPEVKAFVVPIPYYEKENHGQDFVEKYDGDRFPPYVPVMDYRNYNVQEHRPDIAYIHNPFDQFNTVTSVHPDYYSHELKKYVTKLVYVPYFLTNSAVYYTHRELPSYYHVDYIVVQCDKMIESFSPNIPREKFIPVGSPIVDRIINLNRNKPDIPDGWKEMLPNGRDFAGKKTVMFNTSISTMMTERENFLDKIESIFQIVREVKDVILIWRPHPLIHSTLKSINEELYQRYLSIERKFQEERLGILDKTADVGVAVALSDAYVGETGSSLIHMFDVAGKPRFYIDLKIENREERSKECQVTVFGSFTDGDTEYFVAGEYQYLCKRSMVSGEVELLAKIPGIRRDLRGAYKDIYKRGNRIYLQSYNGQGLCIYNMETSIFRKFYVRNSIDRGFCGMYCSKDKLFLIPKEYPCMVSFDLYKEEFIYDDLPDGEATALMKKKRERDTLEGKTYTLSLSEIRWLKAEELLQRVGAREIFESEENKLEDFLCLMINTKLYNEKMMQKGCITKNATLDGTGGEKIHAFLKDCLD